VASLDVLFLEPWHGGSHKGFARGLVEHSRHTFESVTMSARFWKWRMQGGAVTLARKTRALLDGGFRPDVLFASSMVNLPAFLSLVRPHLAGTPVVLYFHENQVTYPLPPGEERDLTYGYINFLSALAADRVAFNSAFHRDEFLGALPRLLRAFPDYTHLETVREIEQKSQVLHLGLPLARHDAFADVRTLRAWGPSLSHDEPPVILWNQRWEYDKNPQAFFRLLGRLDDVGVRFRLILAGEHFERQPVDFDAAFERYAGRILHYGYAEDFAEYSALLHRSDLVVSTAHHEFFGIAIQEAIYCGCHPLLPRRLSYPELIPDDLHAPLLHAPVLYDDEDALFEAARAILTGQERPLPLETLRSIARPLDWRGQIAAYDDLIERAALAGAGVSSAWHADAQTPEAD
jgi:glycosyltransferase involved in cell wall biosynthesis